MRLNNKIEEELKELNSSLPTGKTEVFSVPEGYFQNLAASILKKIKEDNPREEIGILSPLLASISKEMSYSVPENYFETNLEVLPYIIHDTESTLLSSISKEVPYEVPSGYFENIHPHIEKPVAKVIPLFSRKWMKMAAAAVITGVFALAGYNYFNDGTAEVEPKVIALDTNKKIETSITNTTASLVQDLKTVSIQELNTFIEKVDVTPAKSTVTTKTASKKEVKELLKDVPDNDLNSFLDQISYSDEDELFIID